MKFNLNAIFIVLLSLTTNVYLARPPYGRLMRPLPTITLSTRAALMELADVPHDIKSAVAQISQGSEQFSFDLVRVSQSKRNIDKTGIHIT